MFRVHTLRNAGWRTAHSARGGLAASLRGGEVVESPTCGLREHLPLTRESLLAAKDQKR